MLLRIRVIWGIVMTNLLIKLFVKDSKTHPIPLSESVTGISEHLPVLYLTYFCFSES